MNIQNLNNSLSLYKNSCKKLKSKKNCNSIATNTITQSIPLCSIKANFIPSFGKYRKVANVILTDRDTQMPVIASLTKERTGDFVSFQIKTKRNQEAGYLHMDLDPTEIRDKVIPRDKNGNTIPEVTHLRSILGNKYSGIGTTLINAAIEESLKYGKEGNLFLKTETGYGWSLSDYRKNENPIPFYYKMGFEAVNPEVDMLISECIKKADYGKLPPSALLLLSYNSKMEKNNQFIHEFELKS